MESYTQRMEDQLFCLDPVDAEEVDYRKLTEFLNSEFRTFGKALSALISGIIPPDSDRSPLDYLKACYKERGIPAPSRGTLNNWFSGGLRPKKSEASRKMMFEMAFALNLDASQTTTLFQKAYLDRAFNPRDYRELIYYYCLQRDLPYDHACGLIQAVCADAPGADATIFTSNIRELVSSTASDTELIAYINTHQHNFSISNRNAMRILEHYLQKARGYAASEESIGADADTATSYKGMQTDSVNRLYFIIIGRKVSQRKGTTTVPFKDAQLPQEIRVNFPQAATFADKNPSTEEIRKMLVLLFSYCFWSEAKKRNETDILDDYIADLNCTLA